MSSLRFRFVSATVQSLCLTGGTKSRSSEVGNWKEIKGRSDVGWTGHGVGQTEGESAFGKEWFLNKKWWKINSKSNVLYQYLWAVSVFVGEVNTGCGLLPRVIYSQCCYLWTGFSWNSKRACVFSNFILRYFRILQLIEWWFCTNHKPNLIKIYWLSSSSI